MRPILLTALISCATTHRDSGQDLAAPESFEETSVFSEMEPQPVALPVRFLWSESWSLSPPGSELAGGQLTTSSTGPWLMRSGSGTRLQREVLEEESLDSLAYGSASGAHSEPAGFGRREGLSRSAPIEMEKRAATWGAGSGSAPSPGSNTSPLRAGSTDDNAAYAEYLSFLDSWVEREGVAGRYDATDVGDRRWIQLRDVRGAPLPGARVSVVDPVSDRVVWSGTTYGDGRVPFYPALDPAGAPRVEGETPPDDGWWVQASIGEHVQQKRWTGETESLEMTVDLAPVRAPVQLDVAFVIDTTGSMSDEIARIKQTLRTLTERLGEEQEVELRYGAVLYRDVGDEYVTSRHPFTSDIDAFDSALQQIRAQGGGDMPESMNQGLAEAVSALDWRDGGAKVAFVIADAPPHTDYQSDISYSRSATAALHQGIRIHTVAASGLDDLGSLVFRQVAQLTRGKFIFIEYGSAAASAADHGVTGPVSSNNLDQILYEQLRAEIQGWGRELDADIASVH